MLSLLGLRSKRETGVRAAHATRSFKVGARADSCENVNRCAGDLHYGPGTNGSASRVTWMPSPRHHIAIAGRTHASQQNARPRVDHYRLHRTDAARVAHIELMPFRGELVAHA